MKSRSLAKSALLIAMRSMMGATCSQRDSGWSSHSHSFALNLPGTGAGLGTPACPPPGCSAAVRGERWGCVPPVCSFPPPHFCVLVVSSMGRPMSRLPSSKLGLKYSSGVMAVGLVWLSVCVISVCRTPRRGNGGGLATGPPACRDPRDTHPIVGPHVLLGDAQEGLQGGLTACGRGGGEDRSRRSAHPPSPRRLHLCSCPCAGPRGARSASA